MRGRKQLAFVSLPTRAHADLAVLATNEKRHEVVRLPRTAEHSVALLDRYARFLHQRNQRVLSLIAERVADEDVQSKVFDLLVTRLQQRANAPAPVTR